MPSMYRSSVHKPPHKCTQLNGRMYMLVCVIIIRLCATSTVFVSVVHKNMSYDDVQDATMQVCAQMHTGV